MPLDPSPAAEAALVEAARSVLATRAAAASQRAPYASPPPDRIDRLLAAPSDGGSTAATVFARLREAIDGGVSKTGGGDLSYLPNGGLTTGAIAGWLAAGLHAYTGNAFESPGWVAIEESVLRWMAKVVGWPSDAEGVLLSGGSLANQTAIACARTAAGGNLDGRVAYLADNAHHSLVRALRLSGVPHDDVRRIGIDAEGRMDLAGLDHALARDAAAGRRPWLVAGIAGSTATGAIDPLDALAAIASARGAWLHVDAAYGGFFALTARGADRLRGIEKADSVTLDPHKALQMPYGVGALLVRHAGVLARTHALDADYLRDLEAVPGLPHYFERGPETTRPCRGLLVWLPLQLHGVARFRAMLDRMLDLAETAAARLGALPRICLLGTPALSIVVFRAEAGDEATRRLLAAINGSRRFRVSSTRVDGRIAIRLAFLNHRTGSAELDGVLAIVEEAARSAR